jgi:hypothetical protein
MSRSTTRPRDARSIRRRRSRPVGLIPNLGNTPEASFKRAGDRILLLGEDAGEFGGSAYLRLLFGIEQGRPPAVDLAHEARLAELLRSLIFEGRIRTAHDLAEGGLAVALAEACFGSGLGAEVRVPLSPAALFSETQGRVLIACAGASADEVLEAAEDSGVPARDIGEVVGERLRIHADGERVDAAVPISNGSGTRPSAGAGALAMCGIFGIEHNDDAANLAVFGPLRLQHRGQESAGIVAWDGAQMHVERGMGQVSDIFKERVLGGCPAAVPSATPATRRPARA